MKKMKTTMTVMMPSDELVAYRELFYDLQNSEGKRRHEARLLNEFMESFTLEELLQWDFKALPFLSAGYETHAVRLEPHNIECVDLLSERYGISKSSVMRYFMYKFVEIKKTPFQVLPELRFMTIRLSEGFKLLLDELFGKEQLNQQLLNYLINEYQMPNIQAIERATDAIEKLSFRYFPSKTATKTIRLQVPQGLFEDIVEKTEMKQSDIFREALHQLYLKYEKCSPVKRRLNRQLAIRNFRETGEVAMQLNSLYPAADETVTIQDQPASYDGGDE